MTVNSYAALILDLDGTLIGRDEQISLRVAKAVKRVAARLPVSIASGRESSDVIRFARELGLATPQVSDNGALLLEPATGRELWSAPLEPGLAREIVTKLSNMSFNFIATHPGGTIRNGGDLGRWNLTRVSALDLETSTADALVDSFASDANLHVGKVFLPYNGKWAVDFTRAGVDKANAARLLAQMLGTQTGQVIAAGDSYNDLSLLEVCGLRIVMGDAPPELKLMADYVAPSVDDDGLAVAIEEYILPRL